MKRALITIAILATSFAVAAPSSLARGTTTSPGYNFKINVTIGDTGITLSRSVAKRGWLAHFLIYNKGKKRHVFDIGGLKRTVPAGGHAKLGAYLDTRGQYKYRVDNVYRGYFTVI